MQGGPPSTPLHGAASCWGDQLDISSEFDRRLSIGASIACRLRGAIRQQLGDSCTPNLLPGVKLS